jgi:GH25 family lysozyme M1 (1,4-beta-N-acetylmuramidase)
VVVSSTPRPSVRFAARFVAGAVALTGVIGVVVAPALAAAPAASSHASADHAGSGLAPVTATAGSTARRAAAGQTLGMDVSSYQGNVNWAAAWNAGARFAYTKSTEGTGYTNPYFAQQYNGAYHIGMIRGAYHFALPDRSSGTAQADYFIRHGGGWSADGRTLPPALDIEYNPYGATCYGLSPSSMVSWIRAFSAEVRARAGRYPIIYTTRDWWASCTASTTSLAGTDPLWVARYASSPGTLPAGWPTWRIWQYASSGRLPGDQDAFNGSLTQLRQFALGH